MLKIVGGKHRGRALMAPEGGATRPTASRAREALFNILMHAKWREDGTSPLIDARVLDAFAGTGALGLEALSRGAAHVTFLDNDASAVRLIGENLRKLGETGRGQGRARRRPAAAARTRSLRSGLPRSALSLGPRRTRARGAGAGRLGGAGRRRHG